MGKTHSKLLAARHGRGKAWAQHAMCESALRQPVNYFYFMAGSTALPKEHVSLIRMIQVFIKEEDVRLCPTEERSSSFVTVITYFQLNQPTRCSKFSSLPLVI
jgi:hypothetical protein